MNDDNPTAASYASFTIGPIGDVMGHARKTRELWFGSYFFSWYMEMLISRLVSEEKIRFLIPFTPVAANGQGKRMLLPNRSLTGKYHDRLVVESDLKSDELFSRIEAANRDTLDYFADLIDGLRPAGPKSDHRKKAGLLQRINPFGKQKRKTAPPPLDVDYSGLRDILAGYIQTRFFAADGPDFKAIMEKDGEANPVRAADRLLTSMEASFNFTPGISRHTCTRCKTLPGVAKLAERVWEEGQKAPKKKMLALCPICLVKFRCHHSEAVRDKVFSDPEEDPVPTTTVEPEAEKRIMEPRAENLEQRRFLASAPEGGRRLHYPSILEISAVEIFEEYGQPLRAALEEKRKIDPDAELDVPEIKAAIARHAEAMKPYHKYVAVVQADGDSLGKLAASIGKPNRLSELLFQFAAAAEDLVWRNGGIPIYMGGDDILTLMPVYYKGKTVIDFVAEAAELYRKILTDGPKGKAADAPPTISFGVNIAYYKYPLSTALADAGELLFEHAKSTRDALALQLTHHSGSRERVTLSIGAPEFDQVADLLRWTLAGKRPVEDKAPVDFQLPGGLRYNLGRFENLMAEMPSAERLQAFFENNFNEGEHLPFGAGLDAVRDLLAHFLFQRGETSIPPVGGEEEKKAWRKARRETVGAVMSILKFIRFLTREEVE
jgi:hypothetical protein